MKKEFNRWVFFMSELKKYSTNKYLWDRERRFLKSVYDFGQETGFTTIKQDKAVVNVINRAKREATDRAATKRKRATQEIWQRESEAKERKQDENNAAGTFNREVAGVLHGDTVEV